MRVCTHASNCEVIQSMSVNQYVCVCERGIGGRVGVDHGASTRGRERGSEGAREEARGRQKQSIHVDCMRLRESSPGGHRAFAAYLSSSRLHLSSQFCASCSCHPHHHPLLLLLTSRPRPLSTSFSFSSSSSCQRPRRPHSHPARSERHTRRCQTEQFYATKRVS